MADRRLGMFEMLARGVHPQKAVLGYVPPHSCCPNEAAPASSSVAAERYGCELPRHTEGDVERASLRDEIAVLRQTVHELLQWRAEQPEQALLRDDLCTLQSENEKEHVFLRDGVIALQRDTESTRYETEALRESVRELKASAAAVPRRAR